MYCVRYVWPGRREDEKQIMIGLSFTPYRLPGKNLKERHDGN